MAVSWLLSVFTTTPPVPSHPQHIHILSLKTCVLSSPGYVLSLFTYCSPFSSTFPSSYTYMYIYIYIYVHVHENIKEPQLPRLRTAQMLSNMYTCIHPMIPSPCSPQCTFLLSLVPSLSFLFCSVTVLLHVICTLFIH